MKRRTLKSARLGRSPLTVYLELTAMTLAGFVTLVLADRLSGGDGRPIETICVADAYWT
jgi:hypothetical protein